ncbi:endonuclease-3 [Hydrogenivirga caldilitoris]|uniref:Endonuclease III n=1 Tax=Hydrogenivirga caldilitoris TaxID=246264 RepID=A0A497XMI7_9AQUI|nr:endonuclease III [Hydrogenivirga caldilitoris]RLJ70117.1 endonuclease-3 [Hydrogenivirga caldilitoris]
MKRSDIPKVIEILKDNYERWEAPVVTLVAQHTHDPFKVLICALLSTRTRDETTAKVCKKLFERVKKPEDILSIPIGEIEELIYPVGFYRNKAKQLKKLAKTLIEEFGGNVPDRLEDLLRLPGVGRKVANLVLADGYGIPAVCVDTHVHRITNRWCLIKTKTPEETEKELMKVLPKKYWIVINRLLVAFGQRICTPLKPRCDICPIERFCGKCL